ncbi:MAG: response regulator [Thermoplasmatales archaeon]|nr:response regulator [Thermoplasmatales archaeon]
MNKKIMVVDDEPDILTALRVIFEHYGYAVTTVETGNECIKELEGGFRGVVLMDIMMPEKDGWTTIKEIVDKGLTKNIAIEIITGKGTKDHEKMIGLEPYIYDYLAKPFDPEELISSVETLSVKLFSKDVKD